MQNSLFQMKEIEIARKYVESHHIRHDMKRKCPICRTDEGEYFFTKWNVDYLRCSECGSVFAVCDQSIIDDYMACEELNDLRHSEQYQKQIAESRQNTWKEFLCWIEVRAFRFLERNRNLNILDVSNHLSVFKNLIRESPICGNYMNIDLQRDDLFLDFSSDIVLYNDVLKTNYEPYESIEILKHTLKKDGILVAGVRAGSGFDIVTMKENNTKIYPYEHVLLPSVKGMTKLLDKSGFDILEITTPGVMDVKYVLEDLDKIGAGEKFVKYLLSESNEATLMEFQRFLQKSCMSSFIRVIARKRDSVL